MHVHSYTLSPHACNLQDSGLFVYNSDHSYASYNIVRIIVMCVIADLCNKVTSDNSHNIIPIGKTSKLTER